MACLTSLVVYLFATACSNDRRVLQLSPEVLKISRWLESSVGQYLTYGVVSIAPVCAIVLDLVNRTEAAIRLITFQILVLGSLLLAVFYVCGKSLLKGFDGSLQQHKQMQDELQQMRVIMVKGKDASSSAPSSPAGRSSSGDAILLAARAKVKKVVVFAVSLLTNVLSMMLFAIVSPYGVEAPLLFFFIPMTLVPPIWNAVQVTIHRGRTRLPQGLLSSSIAASHGGQTGRASISTSFAWRSTPNRQPHRVVPTGTSRDVSRSYGA